MVQPDVNHILNPTQIDSVREGADPAAIVAQLNSFQSLLTPREDSAVSIDRIVPQVFDGLVRLNTFDGRVDFGRFGNSMPEIREAELALYRELAANKRDLADDAARMMVFAQLGFKGINLAETNSDLEAVGGDFETALDYAKSENNAGMQCGILRQLTMVSERQFDLSADLSTGIGEVQYLVQAREYIAGATEQMEIPEKLGDGRVPVMFAHASHGHILMRLSRQAGQDSEDLVGKASEQFSLCRTSAQYIPVVKSTAHGYPTVQSGFQAALFYLDLDAMLGVQGGSGREGLIHGVRNPMEQFQHQMGGQFNYFDAAQDPTDYRWNFLKTLRALGEIQYARYDPNPELFEETKATGIDQLHEAVTAAVEDGKHLYLFDSFELPRRLIDLGEDPLAQQVSEMLKS